MKAPVSAQTQTSQDKEHCPMNYAVLGRDTSLKVPHKLLPTLRKTLY